MKASFNWSSTETSGTSDLRWEQTKKLESLGEFGEFVGIGNSGKSLAKAFDEGVSCTKIK